MSLDRIAKQDLETAGAKRANAGEMLKAGLPVPDGFIMTTDCYRCFVRYNGLGGRIAQLLRGVNHEGTPVLETVCGHIQTLFRIALSV